MRKPRLRIASTSSAASEILDVGLGRPGRVGDLPHLVPGRPPELLAREVLVDLLDERRRRRRAGRLEDADLDDLGVVRARLDVDAGVEALGLQEVAVDGGRHHLQVGRVDAGRVDAGDERAADEPARGGGGSARHHPVAAVERRPEREAEAEGGLRREVDVDPAGDAVHADQARGEARLPDQVPVDEGARLDLLERVDADARHDDALLADRAVVADRDALVEARVRADVAGPADDRALDHGAAADRGRGVDHRARRAGVVAERHARHEDGVGPDRGARRDPAVVADERRRLDRLEVVEVDALPHPDVAAQADAGDAQAHALVERVEVGLAVLVEVADVLPVAVADVAVERPAHLQEEREELLREVVGRVGRDVAQAPPARARRCRC